MTEQDMVRKVQGDLSPHTDFNDPYWHSADSRVLESCFDKGFIRWDDNDKLIVTSLGRRSCGGNNERYN